MIVPTQSLMTFDDRAPLDHAAYHQIARDTALGMNYLHKHRPAVLHLDLKSLNILLTTHLRAKIADFGFSKLKCVICPDKHWIIFVMIYWQYENVIMII